MPNPPISPKNTVVVATATLKLKGDHWFSCGNLAPWILSVHPFGVTHGAEIRILATHVIDTAVLFPIQQHTRKTKHFAKSLPTLTWKNQGTILCCIKKAIYPSGHQ